MQHEISALAASPVAACSGRGASSLAPSPYGSPLSPLKPTRGLGVAEIECHDR